VQTPEQAAREQRKQAQLRAKHCVRRLQAAARVRRMLNEWHWRAFRRLVKRRSNGALTRDELITVSCRPTAANGLYRRQMYTTTAWRTTVSSSASARAAELCPSYTLSMSRCSRRP